MLPNGGVMSHKIYNEDCFVTMSRLLEGGTRVDVILTSPFYNTNVKGGKSRTTETVKVKDGQYTYVRYDKHVDNMTNDEYCDFTKRLFIEFDKVLNKDGVVLYNINYGSENTEALFRAVNTIVTETPFTVADVIGWKKRTAIPNSCSPNKLTRIFEFVFVFCRKNELKTFKCNKKLTSYRKTGQAAYENKFNFIEAKNNDGSCPYNKATYSTELCLKLLDIYAPKNAIVYDPFMGSGTTALACEYMGLHCIGSEISEKQCEWAEKRILDKMSCAN